MINPSLAEIISRAIDSKLLDLYTCLPGIVESFSAETNRADIKIAIGRPTPNEDQDIQYEDIGTLPNVQIAFFGAGNFKIFCSVKKGDFVLVLFTSINCNEFFRKKIETNPVDTRMHSLGNPIAIPLMILQTDNANNSLVLEGEVKLGSASASDFVALSSKVDSNFSAIHAALAAATPNPSEVGFIAFKGALTNPFTATNATKVKAI